MSPRVATFIAVAVIVGIGLGLALYLSDLPGAADVRGFFHANKDALSGLSTALSIVGFAAVIVTFLLGLNTLRMTVNQNRAKLSFDVHKEVRTFFEAAKAARPDTVFSFYLSLHEQQKFGNIEDTFWTTICSDIKALLADTQQGARFLGYWEKHKAKFPADFVKAIESLRPSTAPSNGANPAVPEKQE